tara:strand:+ start:494 stop:994 length:501 start_codon:yes stop_codon:yes gene_type:complete
MNYTFYNNNRGFLILGILFILYLYYFATSCPCDKKGPRTCTRLEIYGVQFNHLLLFGFIGFYFPSYFYTSQILGILFEYIEHLADIYENNIIKYIGGCLTLNPKLYSNKNLLYYNVYRNENKYLNPIDRFFGINNSKIHGWHGSIAEILVNIVGFIIGYALNKLLY